MGKVKQLSLLIFVSMFGAGLVVVGAAYSDGESGSGKTKNVILLIGDGMGPNHIESARIRYGGVKGQLHFAQMPVHGKVRTFSVLPNSDVPNLVTESAAAATAWSSGVKTYNGAIGVDAFGRRVPTLMEKLHSHGLRTGNLSTAEITDATPAAMFSHVRDRSCQGPTESDCPQGDVPINRQIADSQTADVIFGGGLRRFQPSDLDKMRSAGYSVLSGTPGTLPNHKDVKTIPRQAQLSALPVTQRRAVGLFSSGNMTIEAYKRQHPSAREASEPSLADMTAKAIGLLNHDNSHGFFLQVEGGLIDKRAHSNDAAQTLEEVRALDQALAVALDFARKDGETLVVVSADHETGGLAIMPHGMFANSESVAPPFNTDGSNPANGSQPEREKGTHVIDPKRSSGPINGSGKKDPTNFGPATLRIPTDPPTVKDGDPEASLWISFLSGDHTATDVDVFAFGPGSQPFSSTIDNTDIHSHILAALEP